MVIMADNFIEKANEIASHMSEKDMQESNERVKQRLEKAIADEEIQLKKKKMKNIFNYSLFSEPVRSLVLLQDYQAPTVSSEQAGKYYTQFRNDAQRFVQSIVDGKPTANLMFVGRPGTGKTYLSLAIMGELFKNNQSVLFLNTSKLKELAYRFKDEQARKKLARIRRNAQECDLLILDDLGTETSNKANIKTEASETMQQLIYDFADSRTHKPILITTNLTKDDFEEIYNLKIISRLVPKNVDNVFNFNALEDLRNRGGF